MFGTSTSRLTRLGLVAGLTGLAVPLMGAGPEVKVGGLSFHPPQFGIKVRFGSPRRPEPRHEERRPEFIMPCDLQLSAFQSGSTVIIVAKGTNRESGFNVHFDACNLSDRTPEVILHNDRGHGACSQVITSFEATASFTSRRSLSCIKVRIGNQCQEVRVVQTPCL